MSQAQETIYPAEYLRQFAVRIFAHCGVPEEDANLASGVLLTADLWGISSHGVARLKAYYEMLERELINSKPQMRIVRETAGTVTVDGDNGLGLVVGPKANELAMQRAEAVGTGWASVRHSNHFGVAGYYSMKALERDMIGWAMTNTPPLVSPLWGAGKMLGTNPISVAFPGSESPPILIDMATSAISYGIVETATRAGSSLPEGLIVDRMGGASTWPEDVANGGSLSPLGGDRAHGGHKGYCLGAMIDILCGVLSGASWGPFVPPFPHYLEKPARSVGKGIGHLFGAFRIDSFIDVAEFKQRIDEWAQVFRQSTPAPGTSGPLIPGDPEHEAESRRAIEGIPLSPSIIADLRSISSRTGVSFD
ncbi:MAG: Ldh family oxidoreductase [Acidobacteriota bacterium]